jgi:drug/metabolite transporter (DMT)-like permease
MTAALLGWAWLNEPLKPAGLYALGLIAAGLWLATLRSTAQLPGRGT